MSLKELSLKLLPQVLKALDLEHLTLWWRIQVGWPPESSTGEPVDLDDGTLLYLVGTTARMAGYPGNLDPATLGEAYRLLLQLLRDHQAEELTAHLSSQLPPGVTLGSSNYILYLRSFNAPLTLPTFPTDWGMLSLEEALALNFDQGPWPLIGLGRQIDVLLGAGKLQSSDETWQKDLRKLSLNADLILVVPSVTAGTSWEVEWVGINDNLRNSIFLMPPSFSDATIEIWRKDWLAVQHWARFMGLSFPDYDRKGLLFTMTPQGGVLKSVSFGEWFARGQWWIALMQLTGTTTDWIGDAVRGVKTALEAQEAESRGVDIFHIHDGKRQEKRELIRSRLAALGTEADLNYLPVLERLDTVIESVGLFSGTRPGQRFSEWPDEDESAFQKPGAYTVWWGTNDLIWAGYTDNLSREIARCASGETGSSFCQLVFTDLVVPSLAPDTKADLEAQLIDQNQMTRFYIHKNLSVIAEPIERETDGKRIVDLISVGVLSVGKPRLGTRTPPDVSI